MMIRPALARLGLGTPSATGPDGQGQTGAAAAAGAPLSREELARLFHRELYGTPT